MTSVSTESARRVLRRVKKAAQIGMLAHNFAEVWGSVLAGRKLHQLRLRNGLTIGAPANVQLWNHFNDIWLDRVYTVNGFDIPEGATVVDIGANIGLFSLLSAQRAARVFSYEPFGPCFDWLSKNVQTNRLGGIVHPFNLAVGHTAGTRTFHVQSEYTSNSFFQSVDGGQPVTVACTTLGAIIDEHCEGRCDFLKLDCEGAEFEILLEARDETLKRVRLLSLEVHEGVGGHTRADLQKRLVGAGFTVESREVYGCVIMQARNKTFEVR